MLGATNGDNSVHDGEGARNGENGAGLAGKAGSVDLRIKTTLNIPEGSESAGANLVVKTLRESNISGTEKVPQARETTALSLLKDEKALDTSATVSCMSVSSCSDKKCL